MNRSAGYLLVVYGEYNSLYLRRSHAIAKLPPTRYALRTAVQWFSGQLDFFFFGDLSGTVPILPALYIHVSYLEYLEMSHLKELFSCLVVLCVSILPVLPQNCERKLRIYDKRRLSALNYI